MGAVRIDAQQRAILEVFRELDPKGEYVYNHAFGPLPTAMRAREDDVGFRWEQELPKLSRRGLLASEGRGRFRQFGITAEGLAAIAKTA